MRERVSLGQLDGGQTTSIQRTRPHHRRRHTGWNFDEHRGKCSMSADQKSDMDLANADLVATARI
jgi:hypothetical protein